MKTPVINFTGVFFKFQKRIKKRNRFFKIIKMKTILFPTDFSPCADNALLYALGICNNLRSKIILHNTFHVNDNKSKVSLNEIIEEKLSSKVDEALMKLKKQILQHNILEVECKVRTCS